MRGKKGFFHDFGVKTVGKRDPMSIFGLKRGKKGGGEGFPALFWGRTVGKGVRGPSWGL